MSKILDFDVLARRIISVFYRIVLFSYGISLFIIYPNYFPVYIYAASFCFYLGSSYVLITKKTPYQKTRLFLDYSFIFLLLYQKPLNNIICIVFLLLPVFNAPNFSGQKRSYFFLYTIPIIIFLIISTEKFAFSLLIPFLGLFCISYFEYARSRAFNFYYSLTNSISDFYNARKESGREYGIYHDIMVKFNSNKFSTLCIVESMFCLSIKDNQCTVQNSSSHFLKIDVLDLPDFIKKAKHGDVFSDVKIKINERIVDLNIIIPIEKAGIYSVFVIAGTKANNLLNILPAVRDKFFLSPFLRPFFMQLSEFFSVEYSFRQNRLKKFEEISNEYEYVLRTINAVHFIRNRLTPFRNYLEMTSDIYKTTQYSEDVKKLLENVIYEENGRSKAALTEILTRSKQILEEGDNPFNVTKDIVITDIRTILSDMREILLEIVQNGLVEVRLNNNNIKQKAYISNKGITIILSDIIGNIKKHSNGIHNVLFAIENDKLLLRFTNKYDSNHSKQLKLKELVDYFDSDENYNIFKMSSKGAFLIKDFSKQMDIGVVAINEELKSRFTIRLSINLIK
jgi:hypothetical protein